MVWLASDHMFGVGDFKVKSPFWFLKILKLHSLYSGNSKIFKNAFGQYIPNRPPKHLITSTNQPFIFVFKTRVCFSVGLFLGEGECNEIANSIHSNLILTILLFFILASI